MQNVEYMEKRAKFRLIYTLNIRRIVCIASEHTRDDYSIAKIDIEKMNRNSHSKIIIATKTEVT